MDGCNFKCRQPRARLDPIPPDVQRWMVNLSAVFPRALELLDYHTLLYPYLPFHIISLRDCLRRFVGRSHAAKLEAQSAELQEEEDSKL